MKRCPKCSRTFPDANQKFCTVDGGLLLADQPEPPPFDPNLTVRATSKELIPPPDTFDAAEAPTSMRLDLLDKTITSFGSSTYRETSPTGSPTEADLTPPSDSTPTSADLAALPHPAERPTTVMTASGNLVPAAATAPPPATAATPPKKKSMLPLVIGVVVILLLLVGGGAAAAGYFLWLKPRMEANRRPVVTAGENENSNTSTGPSNTNSADNANANINSNASDTAKKEPEPFVPTAGAVQFANSKASLDGDLEAHYVDFSFYYPRTWAKDPKSGVAGATSFATVAREFSEQTADYIQERALVSWYPSNGTYDADLPIFAERAKKVTDQISKGLPGYEEVSRGETTAGAYKGYEFRFKGVFKNTGKGDLPYWGRVIFLPPGTAAEKNGVTIVMLATSLAPGVSGPEDVGVQGELPLILESFRFGASR
jgi:hypothetical protein